MSESYKSAVSTHLHKMFASVASGEVTAMDAAVFIRDEISSSYERGFLLGVRLHKRKMPLHKQEHLTSIR